MKLSMACKKKLSKLFSSARHPTLCVMHKMAITSYRLQCWRKNNPQRRTRSRLEACLRSQKSTISLYLRSLGYWVNEGSVLIRGFEYCSSRASSAQEVNLFENPRNIHDSNAIRVCSIDGIMISHVDRKNALRLALWLKQRQPLSLIFRAFAVQSATKCQQKLVVRVYCSSNHPQEISRICFHCQDILRFSLSSRYTQWGSMEHHDRLCHCRLLWWSDSLPR